MSEQNVDLQELVAKALKREKMGARWAYLAVHILLAIVFTAISWGLVISGSEPLSAGTILLSLLAFFSIILHLRNVLTDSGMYQRSSAELLAQELIRRGVDLKDTSREKHKRLAVVQLTDDGELAVADSAEEQPVGNPRTASGQLGN